MISIPTIIILDESANEIVLKDENDYSFPTDENRFEDADHDPELNELLDEAFNNLDQEDDKSFRPDQVSNGELSKNQIMKANEIGQVVESFSDEITTTIETETPSRETIQNENTEEDKKLTEVAAVVVHKVINKAQEEYEHDAEYAISKSGRENEEVHVSTLKPELDATLPKDSEFSGQQDDLDNNTEKYVALYIQSMIDDIIQKLSSEILDHEETKLQEDAKKTLDTTFVEVGIEPSTIAKSAIDFELQSVNDVTDVSQTAGVDSNASVLSKDKVIVSDQHEGLVDISQEESQSRKITVQDAGESETTNALIPDEELSSENLLSQMLKAQTFFAMMYEFHCQLKRCQ